MYFRSCTSKSTNSVASMSSEEEKNCYKRKGKKVIRVVIGSNGGAGEPASGQNTRETPPVTTEEYSLKDEGTEKGLASK